MKKRNLRLLVTAVLMASVLAGCGSSAGISNQYAADTAAATTAPAGAQEEYLYDAGYGEYEAAEAAAETAIPPPMQAKPVERAAAKQIIPAAGFTAAAVSSAAKALPVKNNALHTSMVPKNRKELIARAFL